MDMKTVKDCLVKRIKELREKRGYTQERLAEMAEIEPRSLSKIECGVTFPSKSLASIADALEISLPQLFEFNHVEKTVDTMYGDSMTKEEKETEVKRLKEESGVIQREEPNIMNPIE